MNPKITEQHRTRPAYIYVRQSTSAQVLHQQESTERQYALRAMALELAPYRIRVNAIAPGLTDTAQPRYGSSEAELAGAARAIPLGRMACPEEIARAAVFLASDDAGFVTGQTLHVNGGSYLG